MCTSWVIPSVSVVVGVAVTFGSVAGTEMWGFFEGELVVVSVDWGLGASFGTCASFVRCVESRISIIACLREPCSAEKRRADGKVKQEDYATVKQQSKWPFGLIPQAPKLIKVEDT